MYSMPILIFVHFHLYSLKMLYNESKENYWQTC